MAKSRSLDELNAIYSESESIDRETFAEMRSNILLVAGEHYVRKDKHSHVRENHNAQTAKIRLVKNHMYRVSKTYRNAILEEAPTVSINPQIDTDLQDQKDAELNKAVWLDISRRHKLKERTAYWAKDFVDIAEVCVKIFWDPNAGEFKGYGPLIGEDGEPVLEPTGEMEMVQDPMTGETFVQPKMAEVEDEENPIFGGDFVFENVYAFNLLREAGSESMEDKDRAWIVRKMVDTKSLKRRYRDDEEKRKKIEESSKETYVVFNGDKNTYEKSKGQTLLLEYYWRPCLEYPRGWYVYATKSVILEEGELPAGIWPFAWKAFDLHQTSPRGKGILKVARPYQAEVNRASSKTAEAQVSLGDDKVLYQVGTKLAQGSLLPGVRGISYQGATPTILSGRDGSQYAAYIKDQIAELDLAVMINEIMQQKNGLPVDPYALLYQAASKKKTYGEYIERFEAFLIEVTRITLELAKIYLPDDALISAVGSREQINIAEFRKTTSLSHQIVIEPGVETLTTQLGKQLTFQYILQYVGKDIDKETLGRVLQNLPFGNYKDSFDDLTLDSDIARNEMLALERGEPVEASKDVDVTFMLKRLTSRMKSPEFKFFDESVKANYEALKAQYNELQALELEKINQAKNEFIPIDGPLVGVDLFVQDPADPNKQSKRARIPHRAVEWLIKTLEMQGATLDKIETMNASTVAEVAETFLKQGQGQPQGNAQAVA